MFEYPERAQARWRAAGAKRAEVKREARRAAQAQAQYIAADALYNILPDQLAGLIHLALCAQIGVKSLIEQRDQARAEMDGADHILAYGFWQSVAVEASERIKTHEAELATLTKALDLLGIALPDVPLEPVPLEPPAEK